MSTSNANQSGAKWVLDPSHSELSFKVKHLMISNVKGEFRKFTAEIDGENFTTAPIHVAIEVASIFTNDDARDGHLKSADFFDAEQHKEITFTSTSIKAVGDEKYELHGHLTMKGVTNPIYLEVEFGGIGKDPWGNEKAAFAVSGKINRKDWGVNWNAALETGGVLVSEEVRIHAEVQFVKKSVE